MDLYTKEWLQTEKGKESRKMASDKYRRTEKWRIKNRMASNKVRSTPKGGINNSVSAAIWRSLGDKKNGRHWEDIVGYTVKELMSHLESRFELWMMWSNYGQSKNGERTWSIDHIKPMSSFDFDSYDDAEFLKCWALENLRSLDHIENIKKSNKIL